MGLKKINCKGVNWRLCILKSSTFNLSIYKKLFLQNYVIGCHSHGFKYDFIPSKFCKYNLEYTHKDIYVYCFGLK